jgi:hypothetical protein
MGSTLLAPDDRARSNLMEDFERGGVALNDPTQGLNVRTWQIFTDGSEVRVSYIGAATSTLLFTGTGITEVSLAFDQNMRVAVGYVEGGVTKLYWYDTVAAAMTHTTFANCRSPMVTLDDKRQIATQLGSNDVIFAYIRDGSVRYRQQRERYEVERTLDTVDSASSRITQIGMGRNNRLQIRVSQPAMAVYSSLVNDKVYLVGGTQIVPMGDGPVQSGRWRSRTFVMPAHPPISWARVEGNYPLTFRLYGDGELLFAATVISERPFRLPAMPHRDAAVEIEGRVDGVAVVLATSVDELI